MKNKNKTLLFLVDDDALFLKSLEIEFTQGEGTSVKTFATGEQCLESITQKPDAVILDYQLNSIDDRSINGLETLDRIKIANPLIPVIILSSQNKIEVAVDCMKHKAYDYIIKSETALTQLQNNLANIIP